ncbi:hypothetical protein [Halocatena halophila]|uniref:hypothetical protein n=1 Tax=Halocatena halophila TaxID=2814576 RepID=UPI002ED58557
MVVSKTIQLTQAVAVLALPASLCVLGFLGVGPLSTTGSILLIALLGAVLAAADRAVVSALSALMFAGGYVTIHYNVDPSAAYVVFGAVLFCLGGIYHVGHRMEQLTTA